MIRVLFDNKRRISAAAMSVIMALSLIMTCMISDSVKAADKTVSSVSELQSAIDSAGSGDVITISGTITVDEKIVISKSAPRITIKGGTLKRSSGFSDNMIYVGGPSNEITFDGVVIDGNKSAVSDGKELIYAFDNSKLVIKNCTLKNNGSHAIGVSCSSVGMFVDSYVKATISNTTICDNDGSGIDGRVIFTISDSKITGNGGCGLEAYGFGDSHSFSVKNTVIKNNKSVGLKAESGASDSYRNIVLTVSGGEISDNGTRGIDITSCDATLTGNTKITGNKEYGVCISSDSKMKLESVNCKKNKEYGFMVYGDLYPSGKAKIDDTVCLKYSSWTKKVGTIRVISKLKEKGIVAKVKTDGFNTGQPCIYIEKSSYAKPEQFRSLDSGHTFIAGSDGWYNYELGNQKLLSPVIKADTTSVKKGKSQVVSIISSSGTKLTIKGTNALANNKSYVSIKNGKTGKLQFTAKAPKGTYTFTVTSKASGDYSKKTKKITIKVN